MSDATALELRKQGKTFEEIAKQLGYAGKQGAYEAVKRSLEAITREPATELLKLDLERLDAMWGPHYANAQAGDVNALAACMRIMERSQGGAEIELTMLFADLRGSTELAGTMSPSAFRRLLNAFYGIASKSVEAPGGSIDKYLGDGVFALFIPGFVGPDHAALAIAMLLPKRHTHPKD